MATPASDPAARATGLGPGYAKLWAAACVSFIGDGIYATALPLLAATLTRDPLGVASVEVASQLPWLLFALPAGAYRALVLAALTVAILAGWASIPLLGAAGFLLTVGGTLITPAPRSIIPGLVSRDPARLERANSRLAAAAGLAAGSVVGSLVTSRRSRLLGQRRLLLVSGATFGVVLLVMAVAAIPIITTQAIEAARAAVQPSNSPS